MKSKRKILKKRKFSTKNRNKKYGGDDVIIPPSVTYGGILGTLNKIYNSTAINFSTMIGNLFASPFVSGRLDAYKLPAIIFELIRLPINYKDPRMINNKYMYNYKESIDQEKNAEKDVVRYTTKYVSAGLPNGILGITHSTKPIDSVSELEKAYKDYDFTDENVKIYRTMNTIDIIHKRIIKKDFIEILKIFDDYNKGLYIKPNEEILDKFVDYFFNNYKRIINDINKPVTHLFDLIGLIGNAGLLKDVYAIIRNRLVFLEDSEFESHIGDDGRLNANVKLNQCYADDITNNNREIENHLKNILTFFLGQDIQKYIKYYPKYVYEYEKYKKELDKWI